MGQTTSSQLGFVDDCARELAAAQRAGLANARSHVFRGITPSQALQIQRRVMSLLDEDATTCKVAINPDGIGICAPIFASLCGQSGHAFDLPASGFLGIEVEIAARLSRDVTPDMAGEGFDAVLSSIESFHVGVELVGTRLAHRNEAGPLAQLADNLSTCGYVLSAVPFPKGPDISETQVDVIIDGKALERRPATNAFGNILNPIIACGRVEEREFDGLKAGMLVTTGALSGLIPIQGPAIIQAGLAGFELVEFELM
jgi:2-keto-4-pentenoate hydratase